MPNDEPFALEIAQRLREHLERDSVDLARDLSKAFRTVFDDTV